MVVVPSSSMIPPSPFTGSLSVNFGSDFVFGGALGSPGGSFSLEKPSTVDEIGTSSHYLSFEAYALGSTITTDSLQSEYITTQEWRSFSHRSATITLLVGQWSAFMAGDLHYIVA